MSEPVQCPHCKGDLSFEAVSDLAPESRMSFSVTPAPGEKVSPDTFGGTLVELTKLLNAVGKEIGVPTAVLVGERRGGSGKPSSSEEPTLRDRFAMAALTGLLAQDPQPFPDSPRTEGHFAIAAFLFADAMMAERNKGEAK